MSSLLPSPIFNFSNEIRSFLECGKVPFIPLMSSKKGPPSLREFTKARLVGRMIKGVGESWKVLIVDGVSLRVISAAVHMYEISSTSKKEATPVDID